MVVSCGKVNEQIEEKIKMAEKGTPYCLIGNESFVPHNFDMMNANVLIFFLKNLPEFDKKGRQIWYL